MSASINRSQQRPRHSLAGIRISGVGVEVPTRVVTSAEVEQRAQLHERFGLEAGWLERVTGVKERRWADPEVQPSRLAAAAGIRALEDADVDPREIDTLVFAGITRDCLEPATANLVAEQVGARNARVFDLINACNSLIDAVDVADSLIRSGKAERVLVATGERASLAINWKPSTIEEMVHAVAGFVVGDGGGALVVERSDDPQRGFCEREFRSDATQWRHAIAGELHPANPCECCGGILDHRFRCDGKALFESALALIRPTVETVMERTGWDYGELDVVFCHQPTKRFIDNAIPLLGDVARATKKLWITADRLGNTSTCSLPIAMSEARAAGALVPGARVLVVAPSSGISAACLTLVW